MIAAGITGAALKGGLEIIAKVHAGKNPQTLAETQKIFRVAKSPAELLGARQIEFRNSGVDLKSKLNEKLDKVSSDKTVITAAKTTSENIAFKDGWTKEKVANIPKGKRPNPTEYLDKSYVDNHLKKFEDGGGYLIPKDVVDKLGRDTLGRPDGQFITPKYELDALLKKANGDISIIEKELGIEPGSWRNREIVRIDVPSAKKTGLRMPTGNENGANPLWLPGGKLPTGQSEAVVNQIIKGNYTETPVIIKK